MFLAWMICISAHEVEVNRERLDLVEGEIQKG